MREPEGLRNQLLECAHCLCKFPPTQSQWNHRHDRPVNYCSRACRSAAHSRKLSKEKPLLGPCLTCGQMFRSFRTEKKFCGMKCYTRSPQFSAMLAEHQVRFARNAWERRGIKSPPTKRNCLDCNVEFEVRIPSLRKRYCSKVCYRSYMAKRFDRWLASPQTLALPQNYDEFLSQDELQCLIEGCSWRGGFLTLHMNAAHGLPRDEFKRAAGFNKGTGVISSRLAERMSGRDSRAGVEALLAWLAKNPPPDSTGAVIGYVSSEAKEHRHKARLLASGEDGPRRKCLSCGNEFVQRTPFGAAKYCRISCRNRYYYLKASGQYDKTCRVCGKGFVSKRRESSVCSPYCKGMLRASGRSLGAV